MRNIWLIIKYHFLIFLGNLTSKKNTKKMISGGIICLLVSILMISTFASTAIMTTQQFVELSKVIPGAEEMAMFSNLIIGLLMILLFTVMRSIYPSKYNDTEMLMALPVTKTQIIVAKTFYNYLFDVASYAMVLLPSFVVYYILVPNVSFMVVVWGLVFICLAALLSNAISYIVSLGFLKLASKFKNISLIQSILTLTCVALYMVVQYSIPGYLEEFTGDPQDYLQNIWFIDILLSWILHNNVLNFLAIFGITLIVYLFSLMLRSHFFNKSFKTYQNKNRELKYSSSKIWITLFKKELHFYFGNSTYFINTIFGVLFIMGISIAYRIIGSEQVLVFMNVLPAEMQIPLEILLITLICMLLSTVVTTSVSISLEGKNLWILKAHPFKTADIFIGKILVNVLVSLVGCLIASIFLGEFNNPLTYIIYFIIPLLCSINNSVIGLLINLLFPKLEFDSVEAVVKRSMSYPLSMFAAFVLSVMPTLLYFVVGKNTWNIGIFSLVSIGIYLFVLIVSTLVLMTKGQKIFKKL